MHYGLMHYGMMHYGLLWPHGFWIRRIAILAIIAVVLFAWRGGGNWPGSRA